MKSQTSASTESVSCLMTRNVATISYNASVAEALRMMSEDNCNTIPVVDVNERCIGMLSRADLMDTLLAEDQELARRMEAGAFGRLRADMLDTCDQISVQEVMSERVITASPETSIKEACQLMSSHRIHHLPVVALDNTLMGIVSTFDVINWLAD